ncbi:MAG: PIN domain-containing protein [Clostridia bacterium]|nr:PIN domain-containing protein [Clostridia bacterium]
MRVLIDTCIIVDALQNREPFKDDAQKIFLLAANQHFTGYITAKSATDIYYLTRRSTHSEKTSREVLSKLFKLFDLLDTDGIDCRKAIPSPITDFEDAVMVETAAREEVDFIVTRNLCDYDKSSVKTLSPKEFLSENGVND